MTKKKRITITLSEKAFEFLSYLKDKAFTCNGETRYCSSYSEVIEFILDATDSKV